ncbi:hypothetical protein LTR94_025759, partial [Friedmanniomyces endolithicus]
MNLVLAECATQGLVLKQRCDGGITNIEPAGIGAKGGKQDPVSVRDETGSTDAPAKGRDPDRRVQMARNLSEARGGLASLSWLVGEAKGAEAHGLDGFARQSIEALGVL